MIKGKHMGKSHFLLNVHHNTVTRLFGRMQTALKLGALLRAHIHYVRLVVFCASWEQLNHKQ